MGGLGTLIGIGLTGLFGAITTWGWASAEQSRAQQAQAGYAPADPLGSIFGTGGGAGGLMGMIIPLILIMSLSKGGGLFGGGGSDDDDDTTVVIVNEDDD